ncbi:bestrophin, other [Paragonimus westermani]|uniref:Bestrophin homolog n=1 Tax=Paragonimus westermani TaxID=34504 RepID=A0A5J4NZX6_9TREM|nr:bestrophin, other [Paragonimus westermani]
MVYTTAQQSLLLLPDSSSLRPLKFMRSLSVLFHTYFVLRSLYHHSQSIRGDSGVLRENQGRYSNLLSTRFLRRWYNRSMVSYVHVHPLDERSGFTCRIGRREINKETLCVFRTSQSSINGHDELGARKIRVTIMRYLNLSWILMMRLISDQIATRFSYSEEDDPTTADASADTKSGSLRKSSRVKQKAGKPHKQKISRNTCHPWSIDATEAFKTNQSRSFLQPSARHDLSVPLSSEPITPCTPFVAPLATTEGGFPYPDAFQAEDDPNLRADLLSFNRDPQVRRTFGIIITDADIAAFQRTAVECFRRTKVKYTPEYWIPIQWAQRLVLKALQSGYILDPKTAYYLIDQIGDVRKQMQDLQIFSSIMIPLVYTQVVIIAVYSYFMCQIFACQFVESRQNEDTGKIDLYVPIFSIFSFLFLMGWLKVALCVMNPFGDDDEDFQTSSILDYNLEVSFRSVYMDDHSFPQYLSFPLGKSTPKDKPDDLEKFLNDIDCDLNQLMSNPVENNVCNLEMRPTRMSQCKNCFCCNRPRESMPTTTTISNTKQTNHQFLKLKSDMHYTPLSTNARLSD